MSVDNEDDNKVFSSKAEEASFWKNKANEYKKR